MFNNKIYRLTNDNLPGFTQPANNYIVHSLLSGVNEKIDNARVSVKAGVSRTENYFFDGRAFAVRSGTFLVVDEGRKYECEISAGIPAEGVCIYFSRSVLNDAKREALGFPPIDYDDSTEISLPLFERIYSFSENRLGQIIGNMIDKIQSGYGKAEDGTFIDIAYQLYRCSAKDIKYSSKAPAYREATRRELYRRVAAAKGIIDDCFRNKTDIAAIASMCSLSQYYFIRVFRSVYGITPYRYLLEKRLRYSAYLLNEMSLSVTETAEKSGFSDIYSFSSAFKKKFGKSPSSFAGNPST